jgi:hypothetical protein
MKSRKAQIAYAGPFDCIRNTQGSSKDDFFIFSMGSYQHRRPPGDDFLSKDVYSVPFERRQVSRKLGRSEVFTGVC